MLKLLVLDRPGSATMEQLVLLLGQETEQLREADAIGVEYVGLKGPSALADQQAR